MDELAFELVPPTQLGKIASMAQDDHGVALREPFVVIGIDLDDAIGAAESDDQESVIAADLDRTDRLTDEWRSARQPQVLRSEAQLFELPTVDTLRCTACDRRRTAVAPEHIGADPRPRTGPLTAQASGHRPSRLTRRDQSSVVERVARTSCYRPERAMVIAPR